MNKNASKKPPKQAALERQVIVLADRLAIALSRIEDEELEAFFDGLDDEAWKQEAGWLLNNDEATEALRCKWRETIGYKAAIVKIRRMLKGEVRGGNVTNAAHAA